MERNLNEKKSIIVEKIKRNVQIAINAKKSAAKKKNFLMLKERWQVTIVAEFYLKVEEIMAKFVQE